MIVDGFAGPGGWDEGLLLLGRSDVIGLEWDTEACATHAAAGHKTIQCDVSMMTPPAWASIEGLIMSAPCQAFSQAGNREGVVHAPDLMRAIKRHEWSFRPCEDPTVWLSLEIGRWVEACHPRWVACENVPAALPLFKVYREVLEGWGYSAWAGVITAEQYGVPQTRERAFLTASRERRAGPPPATHARYESRNKEARRDQGGFDFLQPYVTMAQAFGWPENLGGVVPSIGGSGHVLRSTDEPSSTLTFGNAWPGWEVGFPRIDDLGTSEDGYRERDWRHEDEPAFALTEKARSWQVRGSNDRPNAATRDPDEPAPTVAFGHAGPELVLNTGLDWKPGGDRDDAQQIGLDSPAPGMTGKSGGQWQFRPATTVAGDERLWPPGHKENSNDPPGKYQQHRGEQAIKLTLQQALLLQSFRPDYPVQGSKSAKFRQVGDAVPPLLAAHVLAQVTGATPPS